jgi:hypothetical protein
MPWKSGFADLYELYMRIGHWARAKMSHDFSDIGKEKGIKFGAVLIDCSP